MIPFSMRIISEATNPERGAGRQNCSVVNSGMFVHIVLAGYSYNYLQHHPNSKLRAMDIIFLSKSFATISSSHLGSF